MDKYQNHGLYAPKIINSENNHHSGLIRNRSISSSKKSTTVNSKYFPSRLLTRSQTTIERNTRTIDRELKNKITTIIINVILWNQRLQPNSQLTSFTLPTTQKPLKSCSGLSGFIVSEQWTSIHKYIHTK